MLIKQKSPSLPRNLVVGTFVLNKGKSAIPPLFNRPEVLSSASDEAKLFAKNFSKNSFLRIFLDDSGIPLPIFPSRTNLKLHNLHKNIQLMLEFLKDLFLVLHFSYYTLMTFLMMLYVILLSMLMILLSTLNETTHLICGNN